MVQHPEASLDEDPLNPKNGDGFLSGLESYPVYDLDSLTGYCYYSVRRVKKNFGDRLVHIPTALFVSVCIALGYINLVSSGLAASLDKQICNILTIINKFLSIIISKFDIFIFSNLPYSLGVIPARVKRIYASYPKDSYPPPPHTHTHKRQKTIRAITTKQNKIKALQQNKRKRGKKTYS